MRNTRLFQLPEHSYTDLKWLFTIRCLLGINVYANKSVTLDHSHQGMVDTSIEGNPTEGVIGGLRLHYVFRRKTTRGHDRDGSPLVYALKEMNGYRMQPMYHSMLYNRAEEILATFVGDLAVDALMDVPSSKPLCRTFATCVAKVAGLPLVQSTFLRKRTVGEVLDVVDADFPAFAKERERHAFKGELGKLRRADSQSGFQMKDVSKPMRRFFQPFIIDGETPPLEGQRIALVDDLVSSGTSITSVAECLRHTGAVVELGVCLLSDLYTAGWPR
jgi:hypothetical protein